MTKPVNVIKTTDTIAMTLRMIMQRRLPTCVVTEPNGLYIGEIGDASALHLWIQLSSGRRAKYMNDVRDCLTLAPTVGKFDSIQTVVRKVFDSKSQRVYVVDARGKLNGLIRPKEILGFLLDKEDLRRNLTSPALKLSEQKKELAKRLKHHT
jgi:CBS-domain-containing membrane protein